MIKHVETPFLHLEIKNGNCEVTGTGNTWHYLLLFAFAVKAAKEGQFTNGFANKYEEREFNRILNKVYECPDAAIEAFGQLGDVNSYDAICEALEKLDNLFEALTRTRKWRDEIAEMLYHKDKNGNEEVLVRLYEDNQEVFIDVTADSGMALIKDVIAALEEIR